MRVRTHVVWVSAKPKQALGSSFLGTQVVCVLLISASLLSRSALPVGMQSTCVDAVHSVRRRGSESRSHAKKACCATTSSFTQTLCVGTHVSTCFRLYHYCDPPAALVLSADVVCAARLVPLGSGSPNQCMQAAMHDNVHAADGTAFCAMAQRTERES